MSGSTWRKVRGTAGGGRRTSQVVEEAAKAALEIGVPTMLPSVRNFMFSVTADLLWLWIAHHAGSWLSYGSSVQPVCGWIEHHLGWASASSYTKHVPAVRSFQVLFVRRE